MIKNLETYFLNLISFISYLNSPKQFIRCKKFERRFEFYFMFNIGEQTRKLNFLPLTSVL